MRKAEGKTSENGQMDKIFMITVKVVPLELI